MHHLCDTGREAPMNAIRALVALAFFATYSIAAAADGLVVMKSPYNAGET